MENETFGPYTLHALVGRGGMGEVFRAFDERRGRVVAVKRLPRQLSTDKDFQARFRRESENAARLNHPHIVPIHDYGEIDGQLFIDMRLVEGRNLAEILTEDGPLPAADAVVLIEQVAGALSSAHAAGLVHRDVKPSNVLVAPRSRPDAPLFAYLTDFGIARSINGDTSLTGTNGTAGTLDYMAPERFVESDAVDPRVDVYSLACMLHQSLTGRKPFLATTLPAALHAHLHLDPPRPSTIVPGLPLDLDAVVARGMAKDPADRYATVDDLAADARTALTSPVARPEDPTQAVRAAGSAPEDGTGRRPGGSRRGRVGRVALAAAAVTVAVAAASTLGGFVPTAGTASAAAAAPTTTVTVPTTAPTTAPATRTPVVPAVARGVLAGRTSDNAVTIAVSVKDGKAAAYLCDGKHVEAWLTGTLTGDTLSMRTGEYGGASVDATISQGSAFGTIVIGGRPATAFSAQIVTKPAGLYAGTAKINGAKVQAGWIVLPDGRQVGLMEIGEGRTGAAPVLDPQRLTATAADGTPLVVSEVQGDQPWD